MIRGRLPFPNFQIDTKQKPVCFICFCLFSGVPTHPRLSNEGIPKDFNVLESLHGGQRLSVKHRLFQSFFFMMVSMTTLLPDKEALVSLVRSNPEQSIGLFLELLALLAASETEIRRMKGGNKDLQEKVREIEIRLDKNIQDSSRTLSSDSYQKPSPKVSGPLRERKREDRRGTAERCFSPCRFRTRRSSSRLCSVPAGRISPGSPHRNRKPAKAKIFQSPAFPSQNTICPRCSARPDGRA